MRFSNVEGIIKRLRLITGAKTDKELSEKLGLHPSVVSNWKKRGSIGSWEIIFERFPEIDYNWLIYGEERAKKKAAQPAISFLKKRSQFPEYVKEEISRYPDYSQQISKVIKQLNQVDQYRLLKIAEVLLEIEKELE